MHEVANMKKLVSTLILAALAVILAAVPLSPKSGNGTYPLGKKDQVWPEYPASQRIWLLDQSTRYNFDGTWQPYTRYEYTYDDLNQLVLYETSRYIGGNWSDMGAKEYYYTPSGQIYETLYRIVVDGVWQKNEKEHYLYICSGLLTQKDDYWFYNDDWHNAFVTSYEYSGTLLTNENTYAYDTTGFTHDYLFNVYEYNGAGQRILWFQRYVQGDWEFVFDSRSLYTYNEDGSLAMVVHQDPSGPGSTWVDVSRQIYSYDANGFLTEVLAQSNYGSSGWQDYYRYLYTNDAHGNEVQVLYQTVSDSIWTNVYKLVNLYSDTANEDENVPGTENSLACYPNPFRESVQIDTKGQRGELSVYNLKGQLLRSFPVAKGEKPAWNGTDAQGRALSNGVYLVRFESGNTSSSRKVILLK